MGKMELEYLENIEKELIKREVNAKEKIEEVKKMVGVKLFLFFDFSSNYK